MKGLRTYTLLGITAVLLLAGLSNSISGQAERWLQAEVMTAEPTQQRSLNADAISTKAKKLNPNAHTVQVFTYHHSHPLVVFTEPNEALNFVRLHRNIGKPLPTLKGEPWINALHTANFYWHTRWHATWRSPSLLAAIIGLLFLTLFWRNPLRLRSKKAHSLVVGNKHMLVIYASQTGTAEGIAKEVYEQYESQGHAVQFCTLNEITPEILAQSSQAIFVVATHGQGGPPDNGAQFAEKYFGTYNNLSKLKFGILALGDEGYPDFCGFGVSLQHWLEESNGAQPLFPVQKYDIFDEVLPQGWVDFLEGEKLNVVAPETEWHEAKFISKQQLNPGSPHDGLYLITLSLPNVQWQAGDVLLCQVAKNKEIREYSIANINTAGKVELVVRQLRKDDGTLGLGSGWLTTSLAEGDALQVAIKSNTQFHAAPMDKPQILIGAGSGIAGLRGHWQHRANQENAKPSWLFYGERSPTHEDFFATLLPETTSKNTINTAFSRSESNPIYVQQLLHSHAEQLKNWINQGAYVFVCGSQEGMGEGVHVALQEILGKQTLDALVNQGRYRRDLY